MENRKILIVEDTSQNVDMLRGILNGYELYDAVNGEVALQIIDDIKPDLILLDIMMPGMDGFEVARNLKQNLETRDIPIIFATIRTDSDSIVKGFELGASDYITKPFEPQEVLARVKKELLISELTGRLRYHNIQLEQTVREKTRELKESEEKYRNIVNNSLLGVFKTKLNGEILFANKSMLDMLDCEFPELKELRAQDLYVNPADRKKFISELLGKNRVENFETRIKTKNNNMKLISVFATRYNDIITGEVYDITQKRELELQALEKNESKTIQTLTAGISNEINTPLNLISNNTTLIESFVQDLMKYNENLENLISENDKKEKLKTELSKPDYEDKKRGIVKLINENFSAVTSVSKITEAMKYFFNSCEVEKCNSDVNKSIETVITVLANEWKRQMEIKTDLAENLPEVNCNFHSLNQVFFNALLNGIYSIKEKKDFTDNKKALIEMVSYSENKGVTVMIKDNGTEINENLIDKISKSFGDVKNINSEAEQRLAIMYDIVVNKNQGSVKLKSGKPEGKTVLIWLPVKE